MEGVSTLANFYRILFYWGGREEGFPLFLFFNEFFFLYANFNFTE